MTATFAECDALHEIDDWSPSTLTALAGRITASSTEEHFVYLESEIDELWRLIDLGIADASSDSDRAHLEALKAAVLAVHDLVGVDADVVRAGQKLTAAAKRLQENGQSSIEGQGNEFS